MTGETPVFNIVDFQVKSRSWYWKNPIGSSFEGLGQSSNSCDLPIP
jgi:hypothetical protein